MATVNFYCGRVVGYNTIPANVSDGTAILLSDAVGSVGDFCVDMGSGEVYRISAVEGGVYSVGESLGVIVEVDDALAAGAGIKIVDGEITLDSHAATDTTYGAGDGTNYGHVKTSATFDATNSDESTVLTQKGAYEMYTALQSQIETGVEGASYIPTEEKGQPGGVATLDDDGLVPSSQLPAYVSDIVEVDTFDDLPSTGEDDKIYITMDDNKTYRWGGTTYVEISASLALGETHETAYYGDYGAAAYTHSQLTSGNPHNVTLTDVAGDDVGDTSTPICYNGGEFVVCENIATTSDITTAVDSAQTDLKAYADEVASTAETNAKSYADGVASTAETNAKAYADEVAANAITTSEAYTDTQISDIDHTSAIVDFFEHAQFAINTNGELVMTVTY